MRLGIVLVLGFCVSIPVVAASVKVLGQTLVVPQIAWTRFLFQVVIIGTIMAFATREFAKPRPRPLWPLVLRGCVMSLGSGLIYAALVLMPLAEATAILFIQPLILTALSALILKERVGLFRVVAVCGGLIGAFIIIGPNFALIGWAALLPVGAATCFAVASLLTRAWAASAGAMMFQFIAAVTAMSLFSLTMVVGSVADVAALGPRWPSPGELYLLAFAGIGSTITNLMLVQSFRIAPPSTLAPFFYFEILGAVALGVVVFHHVPGPSTFVGAAMVIAAGLLVWWRETRRR